ncbi:alpha/beta hydrolase family protein [Serinibacter salmoneus]|uniref:Dipeptidyl aminopeptidase/acylaminoacyl peptidase n=1 Tax=Serinibacter salmoneus TaxID=556530 RepID=A0A2A9D3I8_9MICO|nr:S9 family peptidase [Serinibacter salmoneus]PFG20522.1 dipeptidyl aminopeptidase/acylaminoacyl peptidase [Serinibacter salmoneus]
MRPEDLDLLRTVGHPSLDPSGAWAVVAVTRSDLESDSYRSRLWRVPLTAQAPWQPLTSGTRDSSPVVSPDGSRIAFLRATGSAPPQLAIMSADGGEAEVLTDHLLGVSGTPVFSPDSTRIAYVARVPEHGRFGTDSAVGPDAEPARRITTFTYRLDGPGFTIGRPSHLHLIDVPAPAEPGREQHPPRPVRITSGLDGVSAPVFSPDGDRILALREVPDTLRPDLVEILLDVPSEEAAQPASEPGGAAVRPATIRAIPIPLAVRAIAFGAATARTQVTGDLQNHLAVAAELPREGEGAARGSQDGAAQVQEGHEVYFLASDYGPDGVELVGVNAALMRADLIHGELHHLTRLTDPEIDDLHPGAGPGAGGIQVLTGGADAAVLLTRVRRGRTELVLAQGAAAGADLRVLHTGSVVGAHALPDGRVVAGVVLPESPGEVVLLDSADAGGTPRVWSLGDLAAALREARGVRISTELTAQAPDGYPVHGWLATPDPQRVGAGPHPVLLMIHGGPYAAYEDVFFDEVQAYTQAGYAVVYGNPRGGAGYGADHGRAIQGRWGTVDAQDVLALLDHALATHPELDAARTGVLGGSYGGYLTAWLTTRTDRFVAAVVERGFLDPISFAGSSDIGWVFGHQNLGEDPERLAAQSPMAHLSRVVTPTLVIHSEQDWRCPVEQGQRWYVGLRRQGVPTELLLFPGEGHELSRSGRPRHRRERFEAILEWFGRYLPLEA